MWHRNVTFLIFERNHPIMDTVDNAVISFIILAVVLLPAWLAFKVVALAFGWAQRNVKR